MSVSSTKTWSLTSGLYKAGLMYVSWLLGTVFSNKNYKHVLKASIFLETATFYYLGM